MHNMATKTSSMSDEHKQALAQGRMESKVVRDYLEALRSAKPKRGRKRSPESIQKRLAKIETELASADPLTRVWVRFMLGNSCTGSGGDKSCRRRDVECADPIAARTAGVNSYLSFWPFDPLHHLTHYLCGTGYLFYCLPLHAKRRNE